MRWINKCFNINIFETIGVIISDKGCLATRKFKKILNVAIFCFGNETVRGVKTSPQRNCEIHMIVNISEP